MVIVRGLGEPRHPVVAGSGPESAGRHAAAGGALLPILLALTVIAAGGCRRSGGDRDASPPRARRRLLDSVRTELFHAGGQLEDTLLQAPSRLAAGPAGVYVADPVAGRVLRYRRDGSLAFTVGRRGGGPGEYRNIRDVEVDADGRAWVLDPRAGRVTVLDTAGRIVAQLPLDGVARSADRIVPISVDSGAILLVFDRERPFARIAPDGAVLARFGVPWSGRRDLSPLASQMTLASGGRTSWVAAFAMGDGFFVRSGSEWSGTRHFYVEHVRFPAVETRGHLSADGSGKVEERISGDTPVFAARAASISDGRLYVLFGGSGKRRERLLDIYRLPGGRYAGSLVLPSTTFEVSVWSDRLYTLDERPAPRVVAYRLPADSRP